MSFVFPLRARAFFQAIPGGREGASKFIMFDQYYCCLMVGLNARRLGNEGDLEGDVFVNGYPEDYKAQVDIIAGLLIEAELERKGIRTEDKVSIEREMVTLLDPTSPTRLSAAGNKLLNLYAAEGFKLIQDRMLPPSSLEEFLVAYHDWWNSEQSSANGS